MQGVPQLIESAHPLDHISHRENLAVLSRARCLDFLCASVPIIPHEADEVDERFWLITLLAIRLDMDVCVPL